MVGERFWGPLYLPVIALPSLLDAWIEPNLHDTRWYEAGASRRAANWFDERFGSGANGYVNGSNRFFDRESFVSGSGSPYQSPRNRGNNFVAHPVSGVFRFTDLLYPIAVPILVGTILRIF